MPYWFDFFSSSAPRVKTSILKLDWDIAVRRSSRRRTIEIKVSMDGIRVLCPIEVTDAAILSFVKSRRCWIEAKLQIVAISRSTQNQNYNSGCHYFYRGRRIELTEILEPKSSVGCKIGSVTVIKFYGRRSSILVQLADWLRQQSEKYLLERTQYFANRMELVPQRIEVKDYKSIWGRCNSRDEIAFDWRIIQAPDDVLDYLVVHELSHLKHFNHSKEFWALVLSILPDYRNSKRWLLQNGSSLRSIGTVDVESDRKKGALSEGK